MLSQANNSIRKRVLFVGNLLVQVFPAMGFLRDSELTEVDRCCLLCVADGAMGQSFTAAGRTSMAFEWRGTTASGLDQISLVVGEGLTAQSLRVTPSAKRL